MNKKIMAASATLVVLGGLGLIFSNKIIASRVLAANNDNDITITSEQADTSIIDTKLNLSKDKEGNAYVAQNEKADSAKETSFADELESAKEYMLSRPENIPEECKLTREEVLQLTMDKINEQYGIAQDDIDKFDITVNAGYAFEFETKEDVLIWDILLYPKNQSEFPYIYRFTSCIKDETKSIKVTDTPLTIDGEPLENEIKEDEASEAAIKAITEKYALTKETLDKFTVTCKYYEQDPEVPDTHVWWVNLYPTDTSNFSEIGCYSAYVNAETGEVVSIQDATDGKG